MPKNVGYTGARRTGDRTTSGSGEENAYVAPPRQGDTNPPIRGQSSSPLHADETAHIIRKVAPKPDRSQQPYPPSTASNKGNFTPRRR